MFDFEGLLPPLEAKVAVLKAEEENRIASLPKSSVEAPIKKAEVNPYARNSSPFISWSTARRAATMKAQAAIAEATESFIASQTKVFFDGETFEATGNSDIVDQVIKNVVKETRLIGASIKESKFVPVDGKVQAYVLVEYPIGEANQALVNEIKKDATLTQRARRSEAFKELEREVERMRNS